MADRTIQLRNGLPIAVPNLVPIGSMIPFAGFALPDGFLWCDGSTLSGRTYAALAGAIGAVYGLPSAEATTLSYTVNSTLITCSSSHGLAVGDVIFTDAAHDFVGATFPAGTLGPSQMPFHVVEIVSTTTFRCSFTQGGAATNAAESDSGRSWYKSFLAPDLRGRSPFGRDDMGGTDANRLTTVNNDGDILGVTGGDEVVTLTAAQSGLPAHTHSYDDSTPGFANTRGTGSSNTATSSSLTGRTTGSAGGSNASQAHNNLPPFQIVNWMIRSL